MAAENLVERDLRHKEVIDCAIATKLRLCELQLRVIDIDQRTTTYLVTLHCYLIATLRLTYGSCRRREFLHIGLHIVQAVHHCHLQLTLGILALQLQIREVQSRLTRCSTTLITRKNRNVQLHTCIRIWVPRLRLEEFAIIAECRVEVCRIYRQGRHICQLRNLQCAFEHTLLDIELLQSRVIREVELTDRVSIVHLRLIIHQRACNIYIFVEVDAEQRLQLPQGKYNAILRLDNIRNGILHRHIRGDKVVLRHRANLVTLLDILIVLYGIVIDTLIYHQRLLGQQHREEGLRNLLDHIDLRRARLLYRQHNIGNRHFQTLPQLCIHHRHRSAHTAIEGVVATDLDGLSLTSEVHTHRLLRQDSLILCRSIEARIERGVGLLLGVAFNLNLLFCHLDCRRLAQSDFERLLQSQGQSRLLGALRHRGQRQGNKTQK